MPTQRSPRRQPRDPVAHAVPVEDSPLVEPLGHIPGVAILPLRLFLGVTFLYAAWQKITDPAFLKPGGPTYIGSQILGFSHGSPIRFILLHLMQFAGAVGVLTIITELAIGLAVMLGLLTRLAALVGIVLNVGFFLSASWHTYPYFYGADIVFVVAWLTLALAGPGPLALDLAARPRLERLLYRGLSPALAALVGVVLFAPSSMPGRRAQDPAMERQGRNITRGEALLGGLGAIALVVLGLVPRTSGNGGATLAGGPAAKPTAGAAPTHAPAAGATPAPEAGGTPIPAGAKKIGNTSQLPVNTAGVVSDPATSDPAVIVHLQGGQFVAYDAVCTHAGCTVQYDPSQKMLVCPCHGGTFDPAHDAAVVAGPPPTPLNKIQMAIDSKGDIYIV